MGNLFSGLSSDGLEATQDRLGGGAVRPTNAYLATIKAAYAGESGGGAKNVTVILALPDGEFNNTVYVTNKEGKNYFLNKDDNSKKVPLPGFTTINDICIVTTGKELFEQDTEEKVVKVYDFDEKKELPKSVQMLVELIGKQVYVGLYHQTVDKNEKDESTGEYVPSGETRDENVIEKVFHYPTKMTVVEAREAQKGTAPAEAVFFDKWVEKHKDQVRNKAKGKPEAKNGRPGGAPQANAPTTQKKTNSLFGGNT